MNIHETANHFTFAAARSMSFHIPEASDFSVLFNRKNRDYYEIWLVSTKDYINILDSIERIDM